MRSPSELGKALDSDDPIRAILTRAPLAVRVLPFPW